jgi:hypothetical protein
VVDVNELENKVIRKLDIQFIFVQKVRCSIFIHNKNKQNLTILAYHSSGKNQLVMIFNDG